jgi:peptidoglycan/LPS O-acetylase OafA/YrhL
MSTDKHAAFVPSWGRRIDGIEGLRGIAALMVLVTHAGAEMAESTATGDGPLSDLGLLRHGLTLFFVLSGFLLYRPFAAAMIGGSPAPRFKRYMNNRLLRIFPAYIVVLLLVSYVFQTARISGSDPDVRFEGSGALPLSDLLFSLPLIQTLNADTVRVGLGVAWSLTTEFTFYLLLPLLAAAGIRLARKVPPALSACIPALALLAIGWAGKIVFILATRGMSAEESYDFRWGQEWSAVFCRSILVHGDLFAFGMFAAVLVVMFEKNVLSLSRVNHFRLASTVAFVVLGFMAVRNLPIRGFEDSAAAGAAAAVVLLTVLPTPTADQNNLSKVLDWAPLRYAGLVSYGVYLWHIPIMWWLQKRGVVFSDSPLGLLANIGVVIVITYTLSALTYRFVEKPALSLKKRTDSAGGAKRAANSEPAAR